MAADPLLGGAVPLLVKAPGGAPQVFEHVHQVDDDRDIYTAFGRFGLDPVDLVVVPILCGCPHKTAYLDIGIIRTRACVVGCLLGVAGGAVRIIAGR